MSRRSRVQAPAGAPKKLDLAQLVERWTVIVLNCHEWQQLSTGRWFDSSSREYVYG